MTKRSPFRCFKTSPEIIHLAVISSPLWLTTPAISDTRLHVAANMCGFACGYAAGCLLRLPWFAYGATQAGCGVELAVRLLQRTSTPQSQAQSNRRSYWVAPTIERIDSHCVSNPMRVLISLTAPLGSFTSNSVTNLMTTYLKLLMVVLNFE